MRFFRSFKYISIFVHMSVYESWSNIPSVMCQMKLDYALFRTVGVPLKSDYNYWSSPNEFRHTLWLMKEVKKPPKRMLDVKRYMTSTIDWRVTDKITTTIRFRSMLLQYGDSSNRSVRISIVFTNLVALMYFQYSMSVFRLNDLRGNSHLA